MIVLRIAWPENDHRVVQSHSLSSDRFAVIRNGFAHLRQWDTAQDLVLQSLRINLLETELSLALAETSVISVESQMAYKNGQSP